jgi:predicted glycosyltransferase
VKARVALYSHDALGMGHLRRNLAIAGALAATGRVTALLVTGTHLAGCLRLPPGVEVLTLPALSKDSQGCYGARSLDMSLDETLAMRARTIAAALGSFGPHVLIADKHPLGIGGELGPALDALAASGARLVLGMRDILDDPAQVQAEWRADGTLAELERRYDAVWVYGDRRVYDAVAHYGLERRLPGRVRFTGYVTTATPGEPSAAPAAPGAPAPPASAAPAPSAGRDARRVALCLVGGGQDGAPLARAFAAAPLPAGTEAVLVTGPFMPAAEAGALAGAAQARDDLTILDFHADVPALARDADCVVAMGGYNTVCELLALERPVLIVPRSAPRREQLIRAERMAALRLIDYLRPDDLSPAALGAWLAADHLPPRDVASRVDLGGLRRLPALVDGLLGRDSPPDREEAAVAVV